MQESEITIADVISAIEVSAPRELQEPWDNSGWQLRPGPVDSTCTGVLLSLDVTPEAVREAIDCGCNLLVSHHPLLFKGLKSMSPDHPGEAALIEAVKGDLFIYSSHTALDSAPAGVSHRLGELLGLTDLRVLSPQKGCPEAGLGVIGVLPTPLTPDEFTALVKSVYSADSLRLSAMASGAKPIVSVALCSGSGGEFIPTAIASGADAYISSDIRYHDFVDYGRDILIADVGHFESEICTKSIFSDIISKKFPNFAVRQAHAERNPIRYV